MRLAGSGSHSLYYRPFLDSYEETYVIKLTLSDSEREFLTDILDWWCDGLPASREAIIAEDTFTDPEELLELAEGINEQQRRADSIRSKLQGPQSSSHALQEHGNSL